jgi:hypothetical protein
MPATNAGMTNSALDIYSYRFIFHTVSSTRGRFMRRRDGGRRRGARGRGSQPRSRAAPGHRPGVTEAPREELADGGPFTGLSAVR